METVEEDQIKNEINIAFFGIEKAKYKSIIKDIKDIISDKFEEDNKLNVIEYKNILQIDSFSCEILRITLNFFLCEENLNNDINYEKFIEKDIHFFLMFYNEIQMENIFQLIELYSKGNYLFFTLQHSLLDTSKKKLDKNKIYEDISIEWEDEINKNPDMSGFKQKLNDLIEFYKYYNIFQKHSRENIIESYKIFFCHFDKYINMKEKDLFILFNNFEKFSYNNDYPDEVLIILLCLSYKATKLGKFNFKAKASKCNFCGKTDICEFNYKNQEFLCAYCRMQTK